MFWWQKLFPKKKLKKEQTLGNCPSCRPQSWYPSQKGRTEQFHSNWILKCSCYSPTLLTSETKTISLTNVGTVLLWEIRDTGTIKLVQRDITYVNQDTSLTWEKRFDWIVLSYTFTWNKLNEQVWMKLLACKRNKCKSGCSHKNKRWRMGEPNSTIKWGGRSHTSGQTGTETLSFLKVPWDLKVPSSLQ